MEEIEAKRTKIQDEITALKSLLTDSDYEMFKVAENLTDCTSITGIVAMLKAFLSDYGEVVKNRRAWRAKINELEQELDQLDEATPTAGEQA